MAKRTSVRVEENASDAEARKEQRRRIERAFDRYEPGVLPEGRRQAKSWYVVNPSTGEMCPMKIIWGLSGLHVPKTNQIEPMLRALEFETLRLPQGIGADDDFQRRVIASLEDGARKRRARLKKARKKPAMKLVPVKVFDRNPDVTAERLAQAGGYCEHCHQPAPFKRSKDKTPFLEVHHLKPLSKGGDDTVENSIALCPNCHRDAHSGPAGKHLLRKG